MKKQILSLLSLPLFLMLESPAFACNGFSTIFRYTGDISQSMCLSKAQKYLNKIGARDIDVKDNYYVFASVGSNKINITCVTQKRLVYAIAVGCELPTLHLIVTQIISIYE